MTIVRVAARPADEEGILAVVDAAFSDATRDASEELGIVRAPPGRQRTPANSSNSSRTTTAQWLRTCWPRLAASTGHPPRLPAWPQCA